MKTKHNFSKSLIKRFLILASILVFFQTIMFPLNTNADRYPDNSPPNTTGLRGVISTGTIGRLDNNTNDFYGPVNWVKVYTDDPSSIHHLHVTFEGGSTRGDSDGDGSSAICPPEQSEHPELSQRRFQIYKGRSDGSYFGTTPLIEKTYTGDKCFDDVITLGPNVWSNNPEPDTGRHVAYIKLAMWQKVDGGPWNQASGMDHPPEHNNHPSSGYYLYSVDSSDNKNNDLKMGSWGQTLSDAQSNTFKYTYNEDLNSTHVINTYILGVNQPPNDKKRVFEFAPACDVGNQPRPVWLKWFDDDFDHTKSRTWLKMTVVETDIRPYLPDGSVNPNYNVKSVIKSITGYNEDAADKLGLPNDSAWRQKNRFNPGGYNGANHGEGFGGKGGNGKGGKAFITVKKGFKYTWSFEADGPDKNDTSHRFGNRLAVWLPFDTAFADERTCITPPTILCGDSVTWTGPNPPEPGATINNLKVNLAGSAPPESLPNRVTYNIPDLGRSGFANKEGDTKNYVINGAFSFPEAKNYSITWRSDEITNGPKTCSDDIPVVALPYFQALNGAIRVGGDFASSDGDNNAGLANGLLFGLHNGSNGSGTNLSALASIAITGVASAQGRLSAPTAETGLSFANTINTTGGSNNKPNYGGVFGDPVKFYEPNSVPDTDLPVNPFLGLHSSSDMKNLAPGTYRRPGNLIISGDNSSGVLTDNPGGIGKNITIYVDGDVRILHNIKYASSTWNSRNVPSFTLVATGNIYIDNDVGELHGVYIAKKKANGKGGTIYTCSSSIGFQLKPHPNNSSYYGDCNNLLIVRGAFVADKINLMRTSGTLRSGQPAELFLYSPMIYLGDPGGDGPGDGALKYQSITSLPPVL